MRTFNSRFNMCDTITDYNFNLKNSSILEYAGVKIKPLFKYTVTETEGNCSKIVHHYAHSAVNNNALVTMFKPCLDDVNTTEINTETFNALFQPRIFDDIKCESVVPTFSNVSTEKVALASFPGSGNTWTRHLIEQITGEFICMQLKQIT